VSSWFLSSYSWGVPLNGRSLSALGALAALTVAASPEGDALSYESLKSRLRGAMARDPMDTALATVVVGSLLFYRAEKGHNPKVETFGDALVFISTCMSVGYADVFARTPAGKAIATAVMTFGPAITANVLSPVRDDPEPALPQIDAQQEILVTLTAILDELRLQRARA
jgi:voltage-gated potassium channel